MSLRDQIQILVVDDMSTSRGLLIQALESMGISNIHHAADGNEALAVVKDRAIHLVLSDYNMPGMDGLDLLRELRANARTQAIGFILVTGRAEQGQVDAGRALGMNNMIRKPFTSPELKACLEAVIGRI